MMALWHCWGCRPPLTAFHIHIGYMLECLWAPSYSVDMHMGAPLYCYTCGCCPDYGNLGSEWLLWNDGMMTLLRLYTTTDCFPHPYLVYEFEHLHMLWMGIWVHPYTVTPGKVCPDVGNLDQHGYYEMMAWWHCWDCRPLLTASHIHIRIWKVFEHLLHMLWIGIWVHPYLVTLADLAQILVI